MDDLEDIQQLMKASRKQSGRLRRLTMQEKQSIVSDFALGMPLTRIAEKYHVCPDTVSRTLRRFRREHPKAELTQGTEGFRTRLRQKAVVAVEHGLDCADDAYKRGNLGVNVLRGLGDLSGDVVPPNAVQVLIASMPPEMAHEFRGCFVRTEDRSLPLVEQAQMMPLNGGASPLQDGQEDGMALPEGDSEAVSVAPGDNDPAVAGEEDG